MELIKKISVRDVFGGKAEILKVVMSDQEKKHPIMRVVGIASGMRTGESDNGPWTGLKGQFSATNLVTGQEFRSGQCFMPDVANDLVVGALMAEDSSAVEFGFIIYASYDETAATSYIYSAEPLVKPKENDPLAMLLLSVSEPTAEKHGEKKETEKHGEKHDGKKDADKSGK